MRSSQTNSHIIYLLLTLFLIIFFGGLFFYAATPDHTQRLINEYNDNVHTFVDAISPGLNLSTIFLQPDQANLAHKLDHIIEPDPYSRGNIAELNPYLTNFFHTRNLKLPPTSFSEFPLTRFSDTTTFILTYYRLDHTNQSLTTPEIPLWFLFTEFHSLTSFLPCQKFGYHWDNITVSCKSVYMLQQLNIYVDWNETDQAYHLNDTIPEYIYFQWDPDRPTNTISYNQMTIFVRSGNDPEYYLRQYGPPDSKFSANPDLSWEYHLKTTMYLEISVVAFGFSFLLLILLIIVQVLFRYENWKEQRRFVAENLEFSIPPFSPWRNKPKLWGWLTFFLYLLAVAGLISSIYRENKIWEDALVLGSFGTSFATSLLLLTMIPSICTKTFSKCFITVFSASSSFIFSTLLLLLFIIFPGKPYEYFQTFIAVIWAICLFYLGLISVAQASIFFRMYFSKKDQNNLKKYQYQYSIPPSFPEVINEDYKTESVEETEVASLTTPVAGEEVTKVSTFTTPFEGERVTEYTKLIPREREKEHNLKLFPPQDRIYNTNQNGYSNSGFIFWFYLIISCIFSLIIPPLWNIPIRYYLHLFSSDGINFPFFEGTQYFFVIKVFYPCIIYFGSIFIVSFFSLLLSPIRFITRFMKRPLNFRWALKSYSIGEFFLLLLWICSFLASVSYWLFFDLRHTNRPFFLRLTMTTGQISTFLCSWMLLLGFRVDFWLKLFPSIQIVQFRRWHKDLGIFFFFTVTLHLLITMATYTHFYVLMHSFLTSFHSWKLPINIMLMVWVLLLLQAIFSSSWFRTHKWEVFLFFHKLAILFTVLAVSMHGSYSWYFLIFPTLLLLWDKAFGIYRASFPLALTKIKVKNDGQFSKLTLHFLGPNRFIVSPGQYGYLNIPILNMFQWHPLHIVSLPYLNFKKLEGTSQNKAETTASHSTPTKNRVTHSQSVLLSTLDIRNEINEDIYIEKENNYKICNIFVQKSRFESWTCRLLRLSSKLFPLPVAIDGPYGVPLKINGFDRVILSCKGLFIAPLYGLLLTFTKRILDILNDKKKRIMYQQYISQMGLPKKKTTSTFIPPKFITFFWIIKDINPDVFSLLYSKFQKIQSHKYFKDYFQFDFFFHFMISSDVHLETNDKLSGFPSNNKTAETDTSLLQKRKTKDGIPYTITESDDLEADLRAIRLEGRGERIGAFCAGDNSFKRAIGSIATKYDFEYTSC